MIGDTLSKNVKQNIANYHLAGAEGGECVHPLQLWYRMIHLVTNRLNGQRLNA